MLCRTERKIFQGIFIPLTINDLEILSGNNKLRMAYLDGLSYMHDLVVRFTDMPDHSYYEINEALINCGKIKFKYFRGESTLSEHFAHNFETASYFGTQGESILSTNDFESIENMKRDATSYLKALLHTYNMVRTE